jgi:hypothetical protein
MTGLAHAVAGLRQGCGWPEFSRMEIDAAGKTILRMPGDILGFLGINCWHCFLSRYKSAVSAWF